MITTENPGTIDTPAPRDTGFIVGVTIGAVIFLAVAIVILIYLVKHIQRQRRYAAYNKAMVERGIARRSQAINASQVPELQQSLESTANAPQRPRMQPKKTERVSLDRTVSGVWMGGEYEEKNRAETNDILNKKMTQEMKTQSVESKTSFDAEDKQDRLDSHDSNVHVSKAIPNSNESRDETCETSKPKVVRPVPKQRASVIQKDIHDKQEVRGHEVDNERQLNGKEKLFAHSEQSADDASSPTCSENTIPHEVVNDEILYALPMRKPSSIKGSRVEDDDEYATLRVDIGESQSTRPTSRIKSGIAGSYEDLVIGQVPDGRLNVPLDVALKSMSLPSARKVKRMLVGDEEGDENDAAGPTGTQSMKKIPAFNALHKLIGAELKTKHSSLKERSKSTESERLELVTAVTEPWAMKDIPGPANSQVKKKSKKKHDPGYEKVDLDGPPFGVQMPRMPPGALEKLRKQSESEEKAENTNQKPGSLDLSYVDDLHQATEDGSIYTIPMKKTPSVKSTGQTQSQESQNNEQSPDYEEVTNLKANIDVGQPRVPSPAPTASDGVKESIQHPIQSSENRQSSRKLQRSKKYVEEEAFVELGTPGQKNPTLRESGKPPSAVIISDHDSSNTKSEKSGENGVEESAYAISDIVTKSPESPTAVDCDDKKKPIRPPPPTITRKRSMEAKKHVT